MSSWVFYAAHTKTHCFSHTPMCIFYHTHNINQFLIMVGPSHVDVKYPQGTHSKYHPAKNFILPTPHDQSLGNWHGRIITISRFDDTIRRLTSSPEDQGERLRIKRDLLDLAMGELYDA